EVIEVNDSLLDAPEQVNDSPYDDGWFLKIRITDPSELDALLDADGYQVHIEAEHA
ncbi:glycine cleavage system protein H, partial [Candidatus Poribacteria bacterium]|nr:glycine cleavage system protein H [Candidatus Poribacteria bacterium]